MDPKKIDWCGSSLNDLKAFPEDARAIASYELRKVQFGQDPAVGKPINAGDWRHFGLGTSAGHTLKKQHLTQRRPNVTTKIST